MKPIAILISIALAVVVILEALVYTGALDRCIDAVSSITLFGVEHVR